MERWFFISLLGLLLTVMQTSIWAQNGTLQLNVNNAPFVQEDKCTGCPHASACSIETEEASMPLRSLLWPLPFLMGLGLFWFFRKISLKQVLLFVIPLLAIYAIQISHRFAEKEDIIPQEHLAKNADGNSAQSTAEASTEDEFAPFDEASESVQTEDEFAPFIEEEAEAKDEFAPFNEASSSTNDDEFAQFEPNTETAQLNQNSVTLEPAVDKEKESQNYLLRYVGLILLITIIAGFLSRYKTTRRLRLLFLLGALVYMGFYNGGCPCMISSFQDFVMWIFGAEVFWGTMLWFVGLMVITYFFGRVWCGWFCHLGALQEFLFKTAIIKPLKSAGAQGVFKVMRSVTMVVLVTQIALTNTNIFIHYDPFKVAFNLFSTNTTAYVLLFVLLISSLLINRPFCRGFCPVGLAMGWVSRIPGASILYPSNECIGCKSCNNACEVGAIVRTEKISTLDNAECIRCGACQDNCLKNAMSIKASKGQINFTCVKPNL